MHGADFNGNQDILWFSYAAPDLASRTSSRSFIEPLNLSFFGISGWGIDLDYCDIEWFALEINRDHSVIFEIAPKYCISDTFVDYERHSIFLRDSCP